ncbi:MAG: acyl-CoA thioesterase [Prevotellaceae bacterium]|jgi:acyl-CoA thioester hydrolase|nr:acyl-CoA thioesterase [Prevotellaceae bacterium]
MQQQYDYEMRMKVRDYECDIQGIVNNSVYQNYLEHTRHEFLIARGKSFPELHKRGIDPVVARIEIAFKNSLYPGDEFLSRLFVRKEGIKYVFYQDIFRAADEKLCIRARVDTVALINGKLGCCAELDELIQK